MKETSADLVIIGGSLEAVQGNVRLRERIKGYYV